MNEMTDEQLLRAWQAGDRSSGEALFERHYDCVRRFFHNKVCEPGDLIQRTFLACVESAGRYRGESEFRTFLLGIANMLLRSHYRERMGPRNHAALGRCSVYDMGQTPSEMLTDREEERMLLAALRRLPVDLQVVLELRFWEQLKLVEIAEVLELPRGTVSDRIRRSKVLLEQHLRQLASSPQRLHSTLTHLDGWAEQLRHKMSTGARRSA